MGDAIEYFNRYTGRVEEEAVYGGRWLRLAYGNPAGRLATWALVRRAFFSSLYGRLMDRPGSRNGIGPFMKRFGIDSSEFEDCAAHACFNDFFARRLAAGARPIDPSPDVAVFPADARQLGFQDCSAADGLLVTGETCSLAELLGDAELARRYARGALVISRLCPTDYHRFHFPLDGMPGKPRLISGPLDSVSPIALRRRVRILAQNKRVVTLLVGPPAGTVVLVEGGAACVGSIVQTHEPGRRVCKGDEKGCFKFGGSTVITLFEPARVRLADDLLEQSARRRELYARMGDRMATLPGGRQPE